MKSIFYAIADAGGNIYPHTFGEWSKESKARHVFNGRESEIGPMLVAEFDRLFDGRWLELQNRGDHVVKCSIETSENVTVTQIPL